MFPAKCMNPPCMNMEENMVTQVGTGVSMLRVIAPVVNVV
jgi:hypothetical protein